jgi:hypothetical protein
VFDVAGVAPSGDPQFEQNRARSAFSSPQTGQVTGQR